MKCSWYVAVPSLLTLVLMLAACGASTSLVTEAPADPDSFTYARSYAPGGVARYRITRRYEENGSLKRVEEAVSVHRVVQRHVPFEQIAFEGLTREEDGRKEDLSSALAAFPAYEVSLAAGAGDESVSLPDLTAWDMKLVGVITDLNTFLVAISPHAGVDRVHEPGDSYVLQDAPVASWANSEALPIAEDCIRISLSLVELSEDTATYETRFEPPKESGLTMAAPFMEAPIVDAVPNNFQQKMKMGPAWGAMWGRERFVIRSTVRRSDGALLRAVMENDLSLRIAVGCDAALASCQHQMPMHIRRDLSIERVSEERP